MAASAIRVVEYVKRLKLPAAKWERVGRPIEAAIEAAAAGDLEKLRWAMDELALASPVRVIKPDGSLATRADERIFERANVLIDSLQSMRRAAADESAGDEAAAGEARGE